LSGVGLKLRVSSHHPCTGNTGEHYHAQLFVVVVVEIGSLVTSVGTGFNNDPLHLCLLSSWDCGHEPPHPAGFFSYFSSCVVFLKLCYLDIEMSSPSAPSYFYLHLFIFWEIFSI
jgi:hypothetical protein